MRRAAKIDRNQPEIVAALRKMGAVVTPIHMVGKGVSDLLVSWRQAWYVMEVKDSLQPPSKQKLTPDEEIWIGSQKAPVYVVRSAPEAVGILQMLAP